MDKTCLSYWFPKLLSTGVAVPQTRIIKLEKGLWLDPSISENSTPVEVLEYLYADIDACAKELGGYPVFLRTGHTSAKHGWDRTCCLKKKRDIAKHIYEIFEFSEMADIMGLPTHTWVVREFLKVKSPFKAFRGFPVSRERRYFFKDGKVVGRQPYWPPESIDGYTGFKKWKKELEELNLENDEEVTELTALTERAAKAFDGAWSIDWLRTEDRGWVCIDMAEAHKSFIWRDYPHAPKINFGDNRGPA